MIKNSSFSSRNGQFSTTTTIRGWTIDFLGPGLDPLFLLPSSFILIPIPIPALALVLRHVVPIKLRHDRAHRDRILVARRDDVVATVLLLRMPRERAVHPALVVQEPVRGAARVRELGCDGALARARVGGERRGEGEGRAVDERVVAFTEAVGRVQVQVRGVCGARIGAGTGACASIRACD